MKIPPWALGLFYMLVTVAWLGTIGAGIINPEYKAPESVNAVMLAITGGLVGQTISQAGKKKSDDDDDDDKKKDNNTSTGGPS